MPVLRKSVRTVQTRRMPSPQQHPSTCLLSGLAQTQFLDGMAYLKQGEVKTFGYQRFGQAGKPELFDADFELLPRGFMGRREAVHRVGPPWP